MKKYHIKNRTFYLNDGNISKQLPVKVAAALGGVSVQTVYKWISGKQVPANDTIELMRIKHFGLILGLPDWRFKDGLLWCNGYNRPFPPHSLHIMAMLTHRQRHIDDNRVADATRIAALEQELHDINKQFINFESVAPRDNAGHSPFYHSPKSPKRPKLLN